MDKSVLKRKIGTSILLLLFIATTLDLATAAATRFHNGMEEPLEKLDSVEATHPRVPGNEYRWQGNNYEGDDRNHFDKELHRLYWTKPEHVTGPHCVMYDTCKDPSDPFDLGLPCVFNGPAQKLRSDSLATLQTVCPELVEEYGDQFCCSSGQVEQLVSSLAIPQNLIGHCPSCFHNLRQSFCYFTCSPKQSEFMKVNETEAVAEKDPSEEIVRATKVNMIVTESYLNRMYDSCKNATLNIENDDGQEWNVDFMDFFCQPSWQSSTCDPKSLFEYLASTESGFSHIDIYYDYVSPGDAVEGYVPFNASPAQPITID